MTQQRGLRRYPRQGLFAKAQRSNNISPFMEYNYQICVLRSSIGTLLALYKCKEIDDGTN